MKISRRQLPLNALRSYEAAARHCHLKTAAEELGVTQGAVSQQIKALETLLSQALFLRQHKRLKLTSAGKRLLQSITEGLDCITEGVLQLEADAETMTGDLSICSTPSILNNLLMPVIGRFIQKYPEVNLRTVQIGPLEKTLPDDMDISVCFGLPEIEQRPIRKLYDTVMFPVASPGLMINKKAINHGSELLELPLLHDRANAWPDWFNSLVLTDHKSRLSNIYYCDTYQALMAARMGQGVALAEYYEVATDLASGQLVRLLDQSIQLEAGAFLVMLPEPQQSLRCRVFADFIDQYLGELGSYFGTGKEIAVKR